LKPKNLKNGKGPRWPPSKKSGACSEFGKLRNSEKKRGGGFKIGYFHQRYAKGEVHKAGVKVNEHFESTFSPFGIKIRGGGEL